MTLYGILNVLPNLNGKLPKSAQAIKGWNKHTPGRSYPPLTWELAVAIAVQMCRSGHYQYGVGVLLAFDCFLRISELCNITKDNIADAGDHRIGTEHKGTLISLPTTKTGKNQWVEIRDPSVLTLVRSLVKQLKPKQRLFTFNASTFRRLLHATCHDLGLSPLYVPHSLRHGGATRYRHVLQWSIEDVMQRGRWASSMSARRYIQSGVAMLMTMAAPEAITTAGVVMSKDIIKYMPLPQKH
jgi:integrase